ncbi:MAG: hypothetical protein EOO28_23580 [Comamonadaceae bacterium]|nr:MAG: hypothetical protein EOO28_23580 [Comamonadaceae bacterium]
MIASKSAGTSARNSSGLPASGHAGAEPFTTSEQVREYLVLKALDSASAIPADLSRAHDAAFAAVCDGIRAGKIIIDYQPEASGCVDMPAVDHPHYMQAVLYWCAELGCMPGKLVEAHARLGQFASRGLLVDMLGRIEVEEAQQSTNFNSTFSWRDAPRTIPLAAPAESDAAEAPPANLLNIRW